MLIKPNEAPQAISDGEGILYGQFFCDAVYSPDGVFSLLKADSITSVDLVVGGQGIHRVLDQDIPCKIGDISVIPPGVSHGYFVEKPSDTLEIKRISFDTERWFDGEAAIRGKPGFCYGVFRESPVIACAILNSSKRDLIDELYGAISSEISEKKNGWVSALKGYLSILFINIERYVDYAIKDAPFASAREWETVLSVIKAVQERYGESELTLESIASELFISKAHLSELFKKITGRRFSEYLRTFRLDKACELLVKTGMTVEAIMTECGLRDLPSFYKNFNLYTNMTPSEYRRAATASDDETEEYKKLLKGEKVMSILSDIAQSVRFGRAKAAKALVCEALEAGVKPADILSEGLLTGMSEIGEKFKNNEVYVPEVLVAARAMNMGMQELKPHLVADGVSAKGRVCIGTVQGDLHDIGKNLVKMMLEGKGLEVIDLGTDVAPEAFVQAAIEQNCQVICCSALLTTTMGVMGDVVKAAEAAGIRDKVKIMVGGAPVNADFCKSIGADCYTQDAASAADAAVELCKLF